MSKLRLIKKETLKETTTNFWNSCPRKLDYLPESNCSLGKPLKSKDKRNSNPPECAWWINSVEHKYCFWSFIKDKSTPEGSMNELAHADLSRLFGWSSSKTHQIIKESLEELKQAFTKHDLINEGDVDSESYEMSDFSDFIDIFSE